MMKINMQFIALALALLFLNVNGASAQDRSYEGTIRIEPVRLEQSGEFLHIDLTSRSIWRNSPDCSNRTGSILIVPSYERS